ncbi:MAG: hypothetical protein A4E67_01665 [Syntrophaceae bacterium PtaB.Bin038]|nr:MAG: hypothetical protein A4E67_01665 [Syntrophaceae bacterium PtaB.Bin038]
MPVSSKCRVPSKTTFTVISFFVRVPVLSVQMTVVLPRVSTAGSFLRIALRAAMRCTPTASAMVSTTGRPSGIVATAAATTVMNIRRTGSPSAMPTAKSAADAASTYSPIRLEKRPNFSCSGARAAFVSRISWAMPPSTVLAPVSTTTPVPRPFTTTVPMKAMFLWSPGVRFASGIASAVFSAGTDSPVSSDSSIRTSMALVSRMSAGTFAPEDSRTMSPGTSPSLEISLSRPSRTTRASGTIIFCRARTLSSARLSWMNPMTALNSRTAPMTIVSLYSPRAKVTAAAMRRM